MKRKHPSCNLSDCILCRLCLPDWIPAVELNRKVILLRKGQQAFTEGDVVKGIYFIYSGVMKVHQRWDQEKELIVRFARRGDMVGHLGLGKEARYPVSATALEPTSVCYLEMPFFESTLKVNPELTYALMRFLANDLQEAHRAMRNLAHMPVKPRIAQALLTLKNQFGTNEAGFLDFAITRQDIASFAGTTYETLFKVLNELNAGGLIQLDGRDIAIRDEVGLATIVDPGDR
ncbi:Crp/Fnr family transcriptional regulator [Parapedobacter lycopersici]|uniref:Crp/Fnr family transcriptional regulator n=1 Tax=Parapedobacter lycopersici TaxID=1864939 RepID=UPI00214D429E|nr:Crp/Fnr family transcriptional regulator [Parapedobacter lycopersici]